MISPPSKFSSPDCTDVRELARQIYDIYYLMQNNFAICKICTYLRRLVFGIIDIVFSVLLLRIPRQRLGDSFLVYLHSNEMI